MGEESFGNEEKLKVRLKDVDEINRRLTDELDRQMRCNKIVDTEKEDLMEALAIKDTEIFGLQQEIDKLLDGRETLARSKLELEMKCVELEEERDKWEGEKLEFNQEIENLKSEMHSDSQILTDLRSTHNSLVEEHEKFSLDYQAS